MVKEDIRGNIVISIVWNSQHVVDSFGFCLI